MQTSSEKVSEDNAGLGDSEKSVVCTGNNLGDMSNSQSTMCAGLSIKLKVKSNRGKLRKRMPSLRNPFDIGKSIRMRKVNHMGTRRNQNKNEKALNTCLPIIPAKVRGSSVQEALEILASAKNMGLSINRDRATIVKEIAKRRERKEL